MDDIKQSDNSLNLVVEPGYTLLHLRKYIKGTCLAGKCSFVEEENDLEKLYKGFSSMLHDEINLDEMTALFVATSIVYMIDASPENFTKRTQLLLQTFQFVDTLHPMHIHIASRRMLSGLRLDSLNFAFNVLKISQQIAFANETGKAIAICLMWAILGEITETDFGMHRLRNFSDVLLMLEDIDDEMLQMEDCIQIVYILVHAIGFLSNTVVFGKNEILKKAGYRHFSCTRKELKKLNIWMQNLLDKLNLCGSSTDQTELRMVIKEYVMFNIMSQLQEKLNQTKTSASIALN